VQRSPEHVGHHNPGEVVVRWTEPAAAHHQVRALPRTSNRVCEFAAVVADGREVRDDFEARLFSGEEKAAS